MQSGCFNQLRYVQKHLLEITQNPTVSEVQVQSQHVEDAENVNCIHRCATEDQVMEQFGKALRQVDENRDGYSTRSCDAVSSRRQEQTSNTTLLRKTKRIH